ncbi:NirD/YgiW/YdeI family stress tolerance protein [Orbus wheelerorum]|uniref:YgiW/YdeI family stress tolerance OB fold protein n=1 Tax=Orbus wheelerorum TaxID=3074111 RepID=UPI00370D200A
MKKIIPLFTIATLFLASSAIAKPAPLNSGGFVGDSAIQESCDNSTNTTCARFDVAQKGGFQGPSLSISSIEQVKQMSDDQKVVLRGYITQSLGDEDYLFKDDSGTIQVEIDHKSWRGQVITPNDLVEIQGKVDKDWKSIEIDVKRIIKLPAESK